MEKMQERFEPQKTRRAFDPSKERLFKRRTPKWPRYVESPCNRKKWQGHVRTMNRNIHEESHHPTKHEYHTGGWLTW